MWLRAGSTSAFSTREETSEPDRRTGQERCLAWSGAFARPARIAHGKRPGTTGAGRAYASDALSQTAPRLPNHFETQYRCGLVDTSALLLSSAVSMRDKRVGESGLGRSVRRRQELAGLRHRPQSCRDNRSVLHHRWPKLCEDLALARGDGRHPRLIKSLGRADLLSLDDFGLEPARPTREPI
jgi:hypothetical protein